MNDGIRRKIAEYAELLLEAGETPEQIAERLHNFGFELVATADKLRNIDFVGVTRTFRANEGLRDRVQAQVLGPDGRIKQTIDTWERHACQA